MSVQLHGFNPLYIDAYNLQPDEQPAALRTATPLLASLQCPGLDLVLHRFTMSPELAIELAIAAVSWQSLSMDGTHWPETAVVTQPLPSPS